MVPIANPITPALAQWSPGSDAQQLGPPGPWPLARAWVGGPESSVLPPVLPLFCPRAVLGSIPDVPGVLGRHPW